MAGGFAVNIAYMVIPASRISKVDMSTDSIRIGLSLTAPLIVTLMVVPTPILYLIGPEYTSADIILVVLSAAIFPYTIVINAISKFNNLGQPKQIITIGSILVIAFLSSFILLVPPYGTLGVGISILIASVASALPSAIWSERGLILNYILVSLASITSGLVAGYGVRLIFGSSPHPSLAAVFSVTIVIIIIFSLKNTSANELLLIARGVVGRYA